MGQYHKLVNLDKKEVVFPRSLGLGLKQWEHTGFEGGTLADAMYLLVMTSPARGGGDWTWTEMSGRWAGDRVVILGDYTGDNDLPGVAEADKLYSESEGPGWTDISAKVCRALGQVFDFTVNEYGPGVRRTYRLESAVV